METNRPLSHLIILHTIRTCQANKCQGSKKTTPKNVMRLVFLRGFVVKSHCQSIATKKRSFQQKHHNPPSGQHPLSWHTWNFSLFEGFRMAGMKFLLQASASQNIWRKSGKRNKKQSSSEVKKFSSETSSLEENTARLVQQKKSAKSSNDAQEENKLLQKNIMYNV